MRSRSAAWWHELARPVVLLLAGLTAGASAEAQAAVTLEVVWTATSGAGIPGSNTIQAVPGDVLTGELRLTPDGAGLFAYEVSVDFDVDLANELDVVSAEEPPIPAGFEYRFAEGLVSTQESTAGQEGNAVRFHALNLGSAGPTSGTIVVGEVTFLVTANVATDGDDVFPGILHISDAVGNNAYQLITPVAIPASVDAGAAVPVTSLFGSLVLASALLGVGLRAAHRSRAATP